MTPDQLFDAILGSDLFLVFGLIAILAYVAWACNEIKEDAEKRIGEQCLDLEIREVGWAQVVRNRLKVK